MARLRWAACGALATVAVGACWLAWALRDLFDPR